MSRSDERLPPVGPRGSAAALATPEGPIPLPARTTSSVAQEDAFRRILEPLVDALGYDGAAFYLIQQQGRTLEGRIGMGSRSGVHRARFELPADECVEVQVARTGNAAVTFERGGGAGPAERGARGARRAKQVAVVPVWTREQIVGVVAAERNRNRGPIDPPDVEVLKIFAGYLGSVLENRGLREANEAKARELMALQRISRQMTSTLDISELLDTVVQEAITLTGADGVVLYLLEDEQERLRLEAWAGEPPPPDRDALPVGYGIPGWVARHGKPLRVSDRGRLREAAGYASRKSQLAVPLRSEGRVVGVLAVEGGEEEAFSATHEELLSLFAAQAAKAIEAARFFYQICQERDLRDKILAGTPNGIIALDAGRSVVLANQSARRLLDIREDPVGNPVERYLAAPEFLERLRKVLANEAIPESLEVAVGSAETAHHLLVSIFALGEPEDRAATLILQDLTERRKLDERVLRMTRLASIGQLAAGIAHEIRNPLTGVAISLDILGEEELSASGRSLLDDINKEIDRLEALIRGLLDFARPQPVDSRPMRIAKALEWHRTFQGQCRKKGVGFRTDVRQNPKLRGDPERLKQLFLNLAINALEATPEGGEICVSAERVTEPSTQWVRVAVEDTGPGMDPITAEQIFNPFFTTKNEGTGLGLSIAHSIVEQHGGRIDVRSEPGRGTRFTVDLPALSDPEG